MLVELIAAMDQTGAATCELHQEEVIVLSRNSIRMRDILISPCEDLESFGGVENLTVAALPEGLRTLTLAREGIAYLLRRRVPGLADVTHSTNRRAITFQSPEPPHDRAEPSAQCYAAARGIAAGELVTGDDVSKTDCVADRGTIRLDYDRQEGVLRTSRAVQQGDYLGRLMPLAPSSWDAGQQLTMTVRIGPVAIERQVWAMEPDAGDETVFLKAADGAVFSAPVSALAKKREVLE